MNNANPVKAKASNSRQRQRRKIALLRKRVTNLRNDHIAKATTDIVKNHDIIAVEDLAVKNLMQNYHLAKSFAEVSMGKIRTQLKYKIGCNDRTFVMVGRYYASSKSCFGCGCIKGYLSLADRSWSCVSCGVTDDRDIPYPDIILQEDLKIMSGYGMQRTKNRNRWRVRPAKI